MREGPVIIGYDDSAASQRAVDEAAALFGGRRALVVVVWEEGLGYQIGAMPTGMEIAPLPVDPRVAEQVDKALDERAHRLAERGTALAREAGLDAAGVALADQPGVSVAEALVRLADERDAAALVVGAHGHSRITEMIVGSTSRHVIRPATCPVVVVRAL